jgi:curved DNA-binding protein CbpA
MLNPYKTLDVPPTATPEEIEAAFRQRAKQSHPDAGGTAQQFTEAVRSRAILLDPKRREQYDRTGTVDEQEANNPNSAVSLVMGVIMATAQQHLTGGADPTTIPLLDIARQHLKKVVDDAAQRKSSGEKLVKVLRRIEQRLKHKPNASPMLKLAVAAQAKNVEQEIARSDPMVEAHVAALKLLDDWEFEVDYAQPAASIFAGAQWHFATR